MRGLYMTLNALISFSVNGIPDGLTCCLPLPEGVTAAMLQRIFFDAQAPTMLGTVQRIAQGLQTAIDSQRQATPPGPGDMHRERNLSGSSDLKAQQAAG